MAQLQTPDTPKLEATPVERRRLAARLRRRATPAPAAPSASVQAEAEPEPAAPKRQGMLGSFRSLLAHQPWLVTSGLVFGDPPRSRRRDDY